MKKRLVSVLAAVSLICSGFSGNAVFAESMDLFSDSSAVESETGEVLSGEIDDETELTQGEEASVSEEEASAENQAGFSDEESLTEEGTELSAEQENSAAEEVTADGQDFIVDEASSENPADSSENGTAAAEQEESASGETAVVDAEETSADVQDAEEASADVQEAEEEASAEEEIIVDEDFSDSADTDPVGASSSDYTSGDWTYTVSDGVATIKSYNGTASSVTIPEDVTLAGSYYKIRTVEASAFAGNTTLQSVVIPESITSLGNCAFKNCTNLSSVTINGNIGDHDYSSAKSSSDGWYPCKNYSVFYNAGTNTDGMTVTFGASVTRIPAFLFATGDEKSNNIYAHVKKVVLSSSVKEIGNYAFLRCYDLNEIDFSNASALTVIQEDAFSFCTGLTEVNLTGANILQTIGTFAFGGDSALVSVVLPSALTTIEAEAFQDCTALKSIELPESITSLGNCAFKNCTNLSSVTINGNIGDRDYSSTKSSSDGWYPCKNYSVFYNAGTNTDGMTVTFGALVTRIPACLFATGDEKSSNIYAHVKKVVFSSGVKEIGSYAFYACYDLTEIDFSAASSLTTIETGAFEYCTGLVKLNFAGATALATIGESAFRYCSGLTEPDLSSAVTLQTIGSYGFSGASAMTAVTLPSALAKIETGAFEDCTALQSIVLPESVASLGACVFKNCTNLSSVTINGNIGDCDYSSTKSSSDSWYPCKKYSVFYNSGTDTDGMTVTFGASVTRVPAYLFATGDGKESNVYAHVKTVVIPFSVTSIGDGAFYNCYDLTDVSFGGERSVWGTLSSSTGNDYLVTANVTYTGQPLSTPVLSSISNTSGGVTLTWEPVAEAGGYRVYYKSSDSWVILTDTTSTSYTYASVKSGETYTFTVQSVPASGTSYLLSDYDTTGKSITYLASASITSLTNTSSGITIKWDKVAGAKGYNVYRKTGSGSYKKIKTVKSASYTDTSVKSKNGTTYSYAVQSYSGSSKSVYSGRKIVRVTSVGISKIKNTSGKKITLKWAKNKAASGYQIQYSLTSKFKSYTTVNIKGGSTVSKTLSGLKKGKVYYVRIRAYKTVSGKKYYSSWSKVKNVKVKK